MKTIKSDIPISEELLYKLNFVKVSNNPVQDMCETIYQLNDNVYVVHTEWDNCFYLHIDNLDMDTVAHCLISSLEDLTWLINRYNPSNA